MRIKNTSKRPRRIKNTSSRPRQISRDEIISATGAKYIGSTMSGDGFLLQELAKELQDSLKSSGGRPALVGYDHKHRIPTQDADWAIVEKMARKLSIGTTQAAGVMFHVLLQHAAKDKSLEKDMEREVMEALA